VAALPFDRRIILGLNPWIKPIKFELSVIVFLLTVGLMLWGLGDARELARTRLMAWMGIWCGDDCGEQPDCVAVGARGAVAYELQHAAGYRVFGVMGVAILVNTVCGLAAGAMDADGHGAGERGGVGRFGWGC
jgi:hypothetical protein